MTEITLEELLAAVEEAEKASGSQERGMTSRELAKFWKIGLQATANRIREAKELGWLRTGRKRVESIDGRTTPVACYWFEKPKPTKAKRA